MADEGWGAAGAAGQYEYGSLAGGEEDDDAGRRKGDERPASNLSSSSEGRNNFFILLSLTFAFVLLACVGVWLNASGAVTAGPHAPTYAINALREVSICEANFCGDGTKSKSPAELAACSAELRNVADAKGTIAMGVTVQFANPTRLPIQLDRFTLSFRRDTSSSSNPDPLLGDCRTTESNVTVSPDGLNQLRASCSLRVADVADAAAAWWGGAEITVLETWAANVTLAPEGQRVVTSQVGNEGEDPVRFSLPRRPTTGGAGDDVKVTVNGDKLGAGGGGADAASLGGRGRSAATTTLGAAAADADAGTRLSTLFGGTGGGLFPASDSATAGQCPGVMDLRVGSPSFWLCDVGFESGWQATFSKCAGGGGGGALFASWGGGECGVLMKEVVMSVRLVVDNPSDLHVTVSAFKSKVWLSGHDASAGSGWLAKVETLTPRSNTTLEFTVTIPWQGSLGELQDVTGKWWKGESLDAFFNAEFDARALGVSLHLAVPDVKFKVPTAAAGGGGGGDQAGDSSSSSSSSGGGGGGGAGGSSSSYSSPSKDLMEGGCTCLLGVCEFIPAHAPPSGVSTWAGKGAGEGCLISAQCASHKCSWMFKCD
jgi:hypothetical protein